MDWTASLLALALMASPPAPPADLPGLLQRARVALGEAPAPEGPSGWRTGVFLRRYGALGRALALLRPDEREGPEARVVRQAQRELWDEFLRRRVAAQRAAAPAATPAPPSSLSPFQQVLASKRTLLDRTPRAELAPDAAAASWRAELARLEALRRRQALGDEAAEAALRAFRAEVEARLDAARRPE